MEQLYPKLLFQLGYRGGERGLRYGSPNRCLRETPVLSDRCKVSDLVELHSINPLYPAYKKIRFHLWRVNEHMGARRQSVDRQGRKPATKGLLG